MRTYRIYQVREEYFRDYAFRSLQEIRREWPDRNGLPRAVWEEVYAYQTEKDPSLDWLYSLFNRGYESEPGMATPEDFTGHSMSVSDIVETPDGKLWFCDSFGWREVQWAEEARA